MTRLGLIARADNTCAQCGQDMTDKPVGQIYCTRTCSNRATARRREDSPHWKGDDAGYYAIHDWIAKEAGRPQECELCGTTDPGKRYEWANISGQYRRERSDFMRLCKACHNAYDGTSLWQQINPRSHAGKSVWKEDRPVSSHYKGVRASGHGTWRATIRADGKTKNLGSFATQEEAAVAYNEAARAAWGDEAYQNKVLM